MRQVMNIDLNNSANFKELIEESPDILKKYLSVSLSPLEIAIRSQKADIIFIILQAIEKQSEADGRKLDQNYFSLYCTEVTLVWLWLLLGQFEKIQQRYFSHASETSNVSGNPVALNACPQEDDHLYKGVTVLWWIVAIACRGMENDTLKEMPLCELVIDIFSRNPMEDLNLSAKPEHNEHPYIGVTVFWWLTKLTCHAIEKDSQQADKLCLLMEKIYKYSSLNSKKEMAHFLNAAPLNENYSYVSMTTFFILTFSTWMAIKKRNKNVKVLSSLILDICQNFADTLNFNVGLSQEDTIYRVTIMFWFLLLSTCHLTDGLREQEDGYKVWMDSVQKIYHHQFGYLDFTIEMLSEDEPSILKMLMSLKQWDIILSYSITNRLHINSIQREAKAYAIKVVKDPVCADVKGMDPLSFVEPKRLIPSWLDFWAEAKETAECCTEDCGYNGDVEISTLFLDETFFERADANPFNPNVSLEQPGIDEAWETTGAIFTENGRTAAVSSGGGKRKWHEPWQLFPSSVDVPQEVGAEDSEPPFKKRRTGDAPQEKPVARPDWSETGSYLTH